MLAVTPETIAREASYHATRYTPADAPKINETIGTLTKLANETEALKSAVGTWLSYNVQYFDTLLVKYTADEIVLVDLWMNDYCGDTETRTGGSEAYPLTTWKKSIINHRTYQMELRAAFEAVKEQGVNVSWWAA